MFGAKGRRRYEAHIQHIAWVRGVRAAEDAVWGGTPDLSDPYLSFDSRLTWTERLTQLALFGHDARNYRRIREDMMMTAELDRHFRLEVDR